MSACEHEYMRVYMNACVCLPPSALHKCSVYFLLHSPAVVWPTLDRMDNVLILFELSVLLEEKLRRLELN